MTFLLEIRDLPPSDNCTMSYRYSQHAGVRVSSWFVTLDSEPGESGYQVGGKYSQWQSHAHATPAGVDTRPTWEDGEVVTVTAPSNPLRSSGHYAVGMGGLADAPFSFAVACPESATVALQGLGHELDLVMHDSMQGGAGFSATTGIKDAATTVSGSYEATYASDRLVLVVDSYGATQYGTLDISGAIQASYLLVGRPYEVLDGPGGRLRFDLNSTAPDSNDFRVVIFGFDALPA
jgi:hypothetical protein